MFVNSYFKIFLTYIRLNGKNYLCQTTEFIDFQSLQASPHTLFGLGKSAMIWFPQHERKNRYRQYTDEDVKFFRYLKAEDRSKANQ